MATIITAREVVKYAPISKQFPETEICDHIELVEKIEFHDCLTPDFYELLLADVIDYSAVDAYDFNITYNTDDKVERDGDIYIATCDDITEAPTCNCWKLVPKFNADCYNTLWTTGYLRNYLALMITHDMIPFIANKITPQGVVHNLSDKISFEPTGIKGQQSVQKALKRNADLAYKVLSRHICKSECFNDDFKCCINCGIDCEDCCGRRRVPNKKVNNRGFTVGTGTRKNRSGYNRYSYGYYGEIKDYGQ